MYTSLSLSGEWLLQGTDCHEHSVNLPVTVPGYVHLALEKAGMIPAMFWRDNARCCQWIENRQWTFSRSFYVPEDADLSNAELRFKGLDTFADIFLNDEKIGFSNNMFVPLIIPVGNRLKRGENQLKVVIHPYSEYVQCGFQPASAFTYERVKVRRVQCTFWWDWVERFISAGIWQDVELAFPTPSVIDNVFVYTQDIAATSASLLIRIATKNAFAAKCRFKVAIDGPDGLRVWTMAGRVSMETIRLQADIRNAQLWWPNGYGAQPLYTVTVQLLSADGQELDVRTFKTGIRTVRMEYLQDQPGSAEAERTRLMRQFKKSGEYPLPGESCILIVNGVRIFGKGGNYVPPTPFPGTISEAQYENIVRLAAEGGMTLLRVWGGGEYEPDVFYSLCDRYGIMLSQDFMLACGNYPEEDSEFVESFRREIHENVIRLRNHCCIAFWAGNNEDYSHHDWDDSTVMDFSLLESVYYPELETLDPSRPFRPASPWGGYQNDDATIGDCHAGYWWYGAEKMTPADFSRTPRFSSENPCEGYPMKSVLLKFLSKFDIEDMDNGILEYHIKNNFYFTDAGMESVHGRLKRNAEIMLGNGFSKDQLLYNRAYIQYEWARMAIEGMRRAKWYSSAMLFWMFNDCWPALGYSTIDFYGRPKAGWFSCKRAYAPLAASIVAENGSLVFYVLNDSLREPSVTMKILKADTQAGKVVQLHEQSGVIPANENLMAWKMPLPDDDGHTVVFLDIFEDNVRIDRARWYPGWLSQVQLAQAQVSYEVKDDKLTVTCTEGIAIGIAFDGEFVLEDNFIDMLPGESRTLAMRAPFGSEKCGKQVTMYSYFNKKDA